MPGRTGPDQQHGEYPTAGNCTSNAAVAVAAGRPAPAVLLGPGRRAGALPFGADEAGGVRGAVAAG